MVRWSVMLATALGVLAISLVGVLWLSNVNDATIETVRQSRMKHQQLQQQFTVLQAPAHVDQIAQLSQDLDSLKISIVETVSRLPLPTGVRDLAFEQHVLTPILDAETAYPISTLRLSLTLTLEHSVGLVNLLGRLAEALPTWPFEVRACSMQRLAQQLLSGQCVVDFYHWMDTDALYSDQSGMPGSSQDESS